MTENQNPEQQARDRIDAQLRAAGWAVQKKIDFSAGIGQAVREWTTDAGPADYVLFVDKKAVGVIEAKRESETLRGEGDKTAIEIYGKAYSKDPKFYAFYRSLEAYKKSLAKGETTLLLSPDSDFLEYFKAKLK